LKDPAFLFYPGDFLTGTMLFSDKQEGIYIRALCYVHQHGHLTFEELKSLCKNDAVVMSKFIKDNEGNYYNSRLDIEIEKRKKYMDRQRENGSKGGRPPKPTGNPNETHGLATDKPNETISIEISNSSLNNNIDYLEMNSKSIYEFIELNYGRTLTSIEFKKIDEWKSKYSEDIIRYAIQLSVLNNKKTFQYTEGILKNWKGCNYMTLAEIKANEKLRIDRRNEKVEIPDYNWLEDKE
jgi:DnaD/phage-associated family protein